MPAPAPLDAAISKLAARISKIADAQECDLVQATACFQAAAEFLKASKPVTLQVEVYATNGLSTHFFEEMAGTTVQFLIVHSGDVSRVVPKSKWGWNKGLGKLTLLNGYTFPNGSTAEMYFT